MSGACRLNVGCIQSHAGQYLVVDEKHVTSQTDGCLHPWSRQSAMSGCRSILVYLGWFVLVEACT